MLKKANPTQYSPAHGAGTRRGPLGQAMLQVAQLIKANVGLEVAFVELDGWDTHNNERRNGNSPAGCTIFRKRSPPCTATWAIG